MSVRQLVGEAPYRMALHVYPNGDGKFAQGFQEAVEHWEGFYGEHLRPIEAVLFELLMEDGEPWLIHPSWNPPSKDKPSMLYTEGHNIFRDRRWDLIDRAIDLRANAYWRQEYLPKAPRGLDGGGMSPAASYWLQFHRVVRARLHHVTVRFEALPLVDLDRHSGGEYGWLELELLALEDLRKAGKLTPRGYYRLRNERIERLVQIETKLT